MSRTSPAMQEKKKVWVVLVFGFVLLRLWKTQYMIEDKTF